MDPFGYPLLPLSFLVATGLAVRGYSKKSLSYHGAITGWLVGILIVNTGLRGLLLFILYQFGSWVTKYQTNVKQRYDSTIELQGNGGSQRGPKQVLAVSLGAILLSLYHVLYYGPEQPIQFIHSSSSSVSSSDVISASKITCALLAHYATGLADTCASELGMLVQNTSPILITQPWRHVPRGTNGGITFMGCFWSAIGGTIIGMFSILFDTLSGIPPQQVVPVLVYCTLCGFIGSLIDSILGATLQITYYDTEKKQIHHRLHHHPNDEISTSTTTTFQHICGLDLLTNEQVNFVSMVLTSILGGWILGPYIFTTMLQ